MQYVIMSKKWPFGDIRILMQGIDANDLPDRQYNDVDEF